MRVRRGRLSPAASVLMIILGLLTFIYVNSFAGLALIVLGVLMNLVYGRLSRRAASGVQSASEPT